MKNNCPGCDCITKRIIIDSLPIIHTHILKIFRKSIQSGVFTLYWKTAHVYNPCAQVRKHNQPCPLPGNFSPTYFAILKIKEGFRKNNLVFGEDIWRSHLCSTYIMIWLHRLIVARWCCFFWLLKSFWHSSPWNSNAQAWLPLRQKCS